MQQTQDFEGQTSGTTITNGNSGTAPSTAYTTVNTGTAATVQYDNAHPAHGTNAGKFATAGTSTTVNCLQTFTGVATAYGRFYIDSTDWTSSQQFGARLRASGTQAMRIVFDSTGHVTFKDTANSSSGMPVGSVALSNATYYRVEFTCTPGTSTTGAATANVYLGDSLTLLDSITITTANFGTGAVTEYGVGLFTATANVSAFWIDDTNVNDSALPGPVAGTPISDSDTGSGADAGESLTVAVSSSDTAMGADAGESIGVADTDTGAGTDAGESIAAAVSGTDTGAADDTGASVAAALSSADTGSATEGQSVVIPSGVPLMTRQFGASSYLLVEAAWGADLSADASTWTWTDITTDVYYATKLVMSHGRPDNTSQAQPASCSFTLVNDAGNYTAYNPMSVNYPYVRRNTPIRVTADIGTGAEVLFVGYAAGFTPAWDTSANLSLVNVVAGGLLRRLGQGKTPLRSPLYRAISTVPVAPYAYWTMEDGSTAVKFASAVAGVAALAITGAVALGAAAGPGTAASGDFSGGGSVAVALPVPAGTASAWRVAVAFMNQVDAGSFVPLHIQTTTGIWELQIDTTAGANPTIHIGEETPGLVSSTISYTHSGGAWTAGTWHSIILDGVQTGADMGYVLTLDGNSSSGPSVFTGLQLGAITSITVNPAAPVFLTKTSSAFLAAHVAVWSSNPSDNLWSPAAGWAGETPDARLARICAEEGIEFTVTGTSTAAMGPQPIAAMPDILRECETTDGGVLFDGLTAGLGYVCRSSRYNLAAAVTIDAATGQLSPPFTPVDDDQRTRNDVTVSRSGGSSARSIDTDGPLGTLAIDTYDTSLTVNTEDDTPLLDIAGWNLHLGTVEGFRYPTLPVDFLAVPALAADWIAAPDVSFRGDVVNISSKATQHPPGPVESIVEGYSTTIDQISWRVSANCSPFAPWRVGVLDDAVLGKLDTAGCVLHTSWNGVTTGAVLQVDTSTGPLWVTAGGQYPFDLNIGGQQVTVSGCSGSSNPQTFTISAASVNGVSKTHTAGESVSLWSPLVLAL